MHKDQVRDELVFPERERGSTAISPRYVLFVLWYRRNLIIASVCAAFLAAIAYLSVTPVRYTAATTMVLHSGQQPDVETDKKAEPRAAEDDVVQSHVETIKSGNVLAAVVKKLKLTEDPEFKPGEGLAALAWNGKGLADKATDGMFDKALRAAIEPLQAALTRWNGKAAADKAPDVDNDEALRTATETLKAGLKVELIPKSDAVEISYTSLGRKKAAIIANAIAQAYIDDQQQARSELTNRARLWLQQGIAELRDATNTSFKAVQDFKSQKNLVMSGDGKLAVDVETEQLTQGLAKASVETSLAQSRLAQITAVLSAQANADGIADGTVADALSSPVITKLQQQYLDDERLANEYAARYGNEHQTVIKLRSKLAGLKREIREEEERIAETYKSDLKVAQSREQDIEKRLSELFRNDSGNRQAQVKLRELQTAENTNRSVYEAFLNQYTQTVQKQSFLTADARIITSASVGKRTSPNVPLTLMLSLIAGVNLGVAAAFVREQMHRPIYTRDQVARELGVNCIAAFPATGQTKKAPRLRSPQASPAIGAVKETLLNYKRGDLPRSLYEDGDPYSVTSEALRNIEVSIDLRSFSHETRTLGIVSALAGEGKSSISVSLAATIAAAARNVLLIDCDFRNPSLTYLLGLQNRSGLLELVSGEAKLTDATIHHTQHGFDFLCGPTSYRPSRIANILHSERMSSLFDAMKQRYDYVIVDLPPILPVIDVRACAHLFDAFVLVAEWGKTSVDDLDRALRTAPLVRERLLGVALNKVDFQAVQLIEGTGYAAYGRYV